MEYLKLFIIFFVYRFVFRFFLFCKNNEIGLKIYIIIKCFKVWSIYIYMCNLDFYDLNINNFEI